MCDCHKIPDTSLDKGPESKDFKWTVKPMKPDNKHVRPMKLPPKMDDYEWIKNEKGTFIIRKRDARE